MAPVVPPWLPNVISLFRVILVPVWVYVAELANRTLESGSQAENERTLATIILLVIGLSDVADGWIARRFGLQSKLGAMLDAIADKLAQVALFTYLTIRVGPAFPTVPLWLLLLLIARDALMLVGYRCVKRRHGAVDTEHQSHGRLSSLLLFAVLLAYCADAAGNVRLPLLALSAAVLVISTALYARKGARQFRRST